MIITYRNVWGVYVLEDTEDDVAFYCIGIFKKEDDAEKVKEIILKDIDRVIDSIEEAGEEYFTINHCTDENVKNYLEHADLNDGIMVRNCSYKIFVAKEVYYR